MGLGEKMKKKGGGGIIRHQKFRTQGGLVEGDSAVSVTWLPQILYTERKSGKRKKMGERALKIQFH